ncbi:hypothetical protein CsSME_00017789 [Camellia sinensis var. sinensis]
MIKSKAVSMIRGSGNETPYSHITTPYHTPETLGQRFVKYLSDRGNPSPYTEEELGNVYYVFDWLAGAFVYGLPIGVDRFYKKVSIPHEQKDLLVSFLSPVIRMIFIATRNRSQIPEILDSPYADQVELCIIDRDRMNHLHHWFVLFRHKVPLLLLSTEDGPEEHTVIPGLKEERVLATIWNFIRKKVGEGNPRTVLVPIYDPSVGEVDSPNTLD